MVELTYLAMLLILSLLPVHTSRRINDITKAAEFGVNNDKELKFGFFDGGGDGEQSGVSLVEISKLFTMIGSTVVIRNCNLLTAAQTCQYW